MSVLEVEDVLLSALEAGQLLGMADITVRQHASKGLLAPAGVGAKGRVLFRQSEIERYRAGREAEAEAERWYGDPGLSAREAAAALGLSKKGLMSLVRSGHLVGRHLPPVGRRPGELRFDTAQVDEVACARAEARDLVKVARRESKAEAEERRRRWEEYRANAPRFSKVHYRELAANGFVAGKQFSRYRWTADRFPVEPLLALHPEDSLVGAARAIGRGQGITEANIHRVLREGLTWMEADRWAVALGHHPTEVWGRAWWALGYER